MKAILLFVLYISTATCILAQTTVTRNGNTFTFTASQAVEARNAVTGTLEAASMPAYPSLMNGEPIYQLRKVTDMPSLTFDNKEVKLSQYLCTSLVTGLAQLADGNYILSVTNVVIDKTGRLVYYEYSGIKQQHSSVVDSDGKTNIDGKYSTPRMVTYTFDDAAIDATLKQQINAKAQKRMGNLPAISPAKVNGTAVHCTGELYNMTALIHVSGHQVSFEPCYFCL